MALRFKPTDFQRQVLEAALQFLFVVVVAGRRSGKTFVIIFKAMLEASRRSGITVMIVSQTQGAARLAYWDDLKDFAYASGMCVKVNETRMDILLRNGSKIFVRSQEAPDNLRGVGMDLLICDEVQEFNQDVIFGVLLPMLLTRGKKTGQPGRAIFAGTPKGYNILYKLYEQGKSTDHKHRHWQSLHTTSAASGRVGEEELAIFKDFYDEKRYAREYLATFDSLSNRVYWGFTPEANVSDHVRDLGGPVLVGMDFNVSVMTAVVGQQFKDGLHIIDELLLYDSNTDEMAKALKKKYGGREIVVVPDPSGRARKTSASVGVTDHSILIENGLRVYSDPKAPPIVDRVNTVNALIKNSKGVNRLFVHSKCTNLISSLLGQVYDKNGDPEKETGLDHAADALGYLAYRYFPLYSPITTSRLHGLGV